MALRVIGNSFPEQKNCEQQVALPTVVMNETLGLEWTDDLLSLLRTELDLKGAPAFDVVFVDEETMAQLHLRYLGLVGPTDVLAFQAEGLLDGRTSDSAWLQQGFLGDVVICPLYVHRLCGGDGLTRNIAKVVIHGVLHLVGFNHEGDFEHDLMARKESHLLMKWLDDPSCKF